jgi:hypothetical protein
MASPMTEVLDQLGAPKPDSARKTFVFIKSGMGKTPYSHGMAVVAKKSVNREN